MEGLTGHFDYKDACRYVAQMVEANHWEGDYIWFCRVLQLSPSMPASNSKWHAWNQLADALGWINGEELEKLTRKAVESEQRKPSESIVANDCPSPGDSSARKKKRNRQDSHGGLPFGHD